MTADEDRLRELLREAAPSFAAIAPEAALRGPRRGRTGWAVAATVAVVVGIAIALAVTRTSPPTGTDRPPAGTVDRFVAAVPCPSPRGAPRISASDVPGFDPIAAVECTATERTTSIGRVMVDQRRYSTDVADLIAAISAPDPQPSGSVACLDIIVATPDLVLVDTAGRSVVVNFRHDACGLPVGLATIAKHLWSSPTDVKSTLVQSRAEIAADCSHTSANISFHDSVDVTGEAPIPGTNPLAYCLYRASGSTLKSGTFVAGGTLTSAQSMRIRQALTGGAPTASCERQRSFVEIRSQYPKIEIDVELGGCWRTFRNDEQRRIGSADAAVLRSVLGQP